MPWTTREDLHILIDLMPEDAWEEAKSILLGCLADAAGDTVVHDPMDTTEVEPTPAEVTAIEEA